MMLLRSVRGGIRGLKLGAIVTIVAACAGLGAMAQPAAAQGRMGMGPGQGFNNSAITSRELEKWFDMLAMNADQKDAAKALHQAYLDEHGQQTKKLQEVMKNAQQEFMESQDTSAFKEVADKTTKLSEQMSGTEKQFLEDVKALLDGKQGEQWPRVDRHHRRVKSLPGGMLSGENANLVAVVEDLKLSPRPQELQDAIDQYEMDLDKALTERDGKRKEMEKQQQEMMKDFDPSKMDFTKIRQMMADARKSGLPVRDINQRHARLIAGAVPADKKSDFEDRTRKALYPQVYREPYAAKVITTALAFDDATADQKTQIEAVRDSHKRDMTAANDKWVAAISDEEKDGGGDPFMGFGKFVPGGSDEKNPTDDAKKARRELDKAAVEKVKAILTDEQKARLPERENDNPWMMNMGGGGDEDADEKPAKPAKPEKKK